MIRIDCKNDLHTFVRPGIQCTACKSFFNVHNRLKMKLLTVNPFFLGLTVEANGTWECLQCVWPRTGHQFCI